MALLQVNLDEIGDGKAWKSTEIGVLSEGAGLDYEFELPEVVPEEEVEYQVDESGDKNITLLIGAFVDTDGNGQREENEALVGVAEPFLVYVASAGDNAAEAGAEHGWYTLLFEMDDSMEPSPTAYPFEDDHATVDFGPNLITPNQPSALSFHCIDSPESHRDARVDLFATLALEDWSVPDPTLASSEIFLSESVFDGSFAHPLPEPPVEHQAKLDPNSPGAAVLAATYVGIVYTDRNSNEKYDPLSDDFLGLSQTSQGMELAAQFTAHEFSAHLFIHLLDFPLGWNMLQTTESEEELGLIDWSEGLSIECGG